ncbi:hypothetical protein ACEWY4_001056 [Coilia grayii]|uniref:TNFR-Cys domain-containing protein n=1 Tax=Coilia grayii TaxID=363190 RepID=A0ABD1KYE6_9TELE
MPSYRITLTTLLMLSLLVFTGGLEVGCRLWDSISQEEICCTACYSGNRRVKKCGANPKDLCTPCGNGTFTKTDSPWSCARCNQCVDPQILLVPCHGTTDTVCGCKTGYKCADAACSMCTRECGRGEQPYRGRCVKCGTSFSDTKCGTPQTTTTEPPTTKHSHTPKAPPAVHPVPKAEDNSDMSLALLSLGLPLFAAIAIIFALILRQTKKAPIKTAIKEPPKSPAPVRVMPVEQEDCSFCQPQQEQGSVDSLSTQDSMEKLLPPV